MSDHYACSHCLQEDICEEDTPHHLVAGQIVCEDCTPRCWECSEYIDDASSAALGPSVRYRRSELSGKLSAQSHALCAASWIVSTPCEDVHFDASLASRGQIDAALEYTAAIQRRQYAG